MPEVTRFKRCIRTLGLSGKDGDLSFSKTFGLLVLLSYYFNSNLPASVAITLVVSAHGTKLLLELILAWKSKGFPGVPQLPSPDSDERG